MASDDRIASYHWRKYKFIYHHHPRWKVRLSTDQSTSTLRIELITLTSSVFDLLLCRHCALGSPQAWSQNRHCIRSSSVLIDDVASSIASIHPLITDGGVFQALFQHHVIQEQWRKRQRWWRPRPRSRSGCGNKNSSSAEGSGSTSSSKFKGAVMALEDRVFDYGSKGAAEHSNGSHIGKAC